MGSVYIVESSSAIFNFISHAGSFKIIHFSQLNVKAHFAYLHSSMNFSSGLQGQTVDLSIAQRMSCSVSEDRVPCGNLDSTSHVSGTFNVHTPWTVDNINNNRCRHSIQTIRATPLHLAILQLITRITVKLPMFWQDVSVRIGLSGVKHGDSMYVRWQIGSRYTGR